jgi:CSLREA domain-containing protein
MSAEYSRAFGGGEEAALLVTTLEDELNTDGDCSLREAIEAANTNAVVDGCLAGEAVLTDTITFEVVGTITVTSQLSVTAGGPLMVDGGRSFRSAAGRRRVLLTQVGSQVSLLNLSIWTGWLRRWMGAGLPIMGS